MDTSLPHPESDSRSPMRPLPFYGSVVAFYRAIAYCKQHGIPDPFDANKLAEAVDEGEAKRIVSGFLVLGWITKGLKPLPILETMVSAWNTPAWSECIREVLKTSYPFLEASDLGEMSKDELHSAFVKYLGRDEKAIHKCETFFLLLAVQAGFRLSADFKHRVRITAQTSPGNAPVNVRKKNNKSEMTVVSTAAEITESPSSSLPPTASAFIRSIDQLDSLLAFTEEVEGMTEKERSAVFTLIAYVRRKRRERQ